MVGIDMAWKSTYAEYNSSLGCYRAFRKNCGSHVSWTDNKVDTVIQLAARTFDEEFLVGNRTPEEALELPW
jgi:hypothetical protein